jgi:hypothetical protein
MNLIIVPPPKTNSAFDVNPKDAEPDMLSPASILPSAVDVKVIEPFAVALAFCIAVAVLLNVIDPDPLIAPEVNLATESKVIDSAATKPPTPFIVLESLNVIVPFAVSGDALAFVGTAVLLKATSAIPLSRPVAFRLLVALKDNEPKPTIAPSLASVKSDVELKENSVDADKTNLAA